MRLAIILVAPQVHVWREEASCVASNSPSSTMSWVIDEGAIGGIRSGWLDGGARGCVTARGRVAGDERTRKESRPGGS